VLAEYISRLKAIMAQGIRTAKRPNVVETALMKKSCTYGARRMTAQLQRDGMPIDRKTARKYMQEMDLLAIYPRPNLSQPHPDHRMYPYLLLDVTPAYPNHIWSSAITYMRLRDGWLFLMVVLD
jgi:putative transposase